MSRISQRPNYSKEGKPARRTLKFMAIAVVAAMGMNPSFVHATGHAAGPSGIQAIHKIFGPGGKKAGQGRTINVGTLLALTGAGAFVGNAMDSGEKLAAAQIKAAGGPNFQLFAADHHNGDVATGVSGARRLISQNHVPVLLSSYGAVTKALVPLIGQNKVLTFNGGGPDPTQANHNFLWLPAIYYADDSSPGALTWLAKTYPSAKRLVIVGSMENGVNAMQNLVPKYWPQIRSGGTVAGTEINTVGQTDFTQMVARIKSEKPDVIWTDTFGNDLGYLMKALRQANVTVPVMGQELSTDACKIGGSAYNTLTFSGSYFDPAIATNPFAKEFVAAFHKAYGHNPELYGGTYYEDMFIVWELVKRVIAAGGNPNSGTALQQALIKSPHFKSILGGSATTVATLSMSPKDHSGSRPMGIFKINNCTAHQVATIVKIKPGANPKAGLKG